MESAKGNLSSRAVFRHCIEKEKNQLKGKERRADTQGEKRRLFTGENHPW